MNVGAVGYEGLQAGIIHEGRDAFSGSRDVDRISVEIVSNGPGLVSRPPPHTAPGALLIERLGSGLDGSFEEVHVPLGRKNDYGGSGELVPDIAVACPGGEETSVRRGRVPAEYVCQGRCNLVIDCPEIDVDRLTRSGLVVPA